MAVTYSKYIMWQYNPRIILEHSSQVEKKVLGLPHSKNTLYVYSPCCPIQGTLPIV